VASEEVMVSEVTKRLRRQLVLSRVSLTAAAASVLGLIGANGAGKTTLLRLLLGLMRPDSGRVSLFGNAPQVALRMHRVAYFGGGARLPPTVRVGSWTGLLNPRNSTSRDRRQFGSLSRGQRQLVGLRSVLDTRDARLVVLDEPWDGLDPRSAEWLSARLRDCRDRGAVVLVSSHRLDDLASVCDRYAFLHAGRITTRTDDELNSSAHAESLRLTFRQLTTEESNE